MNLKTTLLALASVLCIGALHAQTYTMTQNGNDTASSCSGTLYDNGGPSGNYYSYSYDYFYIMPSGGGSLSLTFTSFDVESSDYVRVYQLVNGSLSSIGYYSGSSLPNSGNPINIPSGQAVIRFYSNCCTSYSGFALTWSAVSSSSPSAQFTISNSNPPLNLPISFTNTSTNGYIYSWDFGDGTTSTDVNPSHSYSSPGNYSAKLIAENCLGSDTSVAHNITVMASPHFSVNPDSVYASVGCGNTVSQSFTVTQDSGGTMTYNLTSKDLSTNPFILDEGFESGLGQFVFSPNASTGSSANVILGGAATGNASLQLSSYTGSLSGVNSSFAGSQPTEFSYYVKVQSSSDRYGYIVLGDDFANTSQALYYARIYYGSLTVYTYSGTYNYTLGINQWNHVEIKNIDWSNNTFDLYINGQLQASSLSFYSSNISQVTGLSLYNTGYYNFYYDDFKLKNVPASTISISPSSGILASGNSNTINLSLNTSGKYAGRYLYQVNLKTNANGADSNRVIPFVLDITGSSTINMDKTCLNFGQVYSSLTAMDSVMFTNTGCDTLDISSITSTNTDFTTSQTALKIPPFDTAYLYVTFDPSGIATYADTIHLTTNDVDTNICLSANAIGTPLIATDSSSYNLTSTGCQDSIPFNFQIIDTGQSALNWTIQQGNGSFLFDDFESGYNYSLWQSYGSCLVKSTCLTYSGTKTLAITGSNRDVRTVPISVSASDTLKFYFTPSINGSGSDCENPDSGENVSLQYSTNNGSSWNTINIFTSTTVGGFKTFAVPAGAVSTHTQFRFYQTSYTIVAGDNYFIDDFSVGTHNSGHFSPATGTTAASDTTSISGYLMVSGLVSGTYQRTVNINSNDPTDSVHSVIVNITVNGIPQIETPASCVALGKAFLGTSTTDSVYISNSGCDSLNISSITSTNSDFSATMATNPLAPGDSALVTITFTPSVIGLNQDTLYFNNNGSTGYICVTGEGEGAPVANLNPDSIYVSFTSCNDSITVPLKLINGGLSQLTYKVSGQSTSSSGLKVVLYQYGSSSYEYSHVKSLITSMPNVTLLESNATTVSALTNDLNGADVIVFPESSLLATSLAATIQSFCTNGGTYIQLLSYSNAPANIGILPLNYITYSAGSTIYNVVPSHPIMNGVASSYYGYSATGEIYMTGNNYSILANSSTSSSNSAVVAVGDYGSGQWAFLGFDFYNYGTDQTLMLQQAVQWGGASRLADFITVNPDSGAVAPSDSVTINVTINSLGLTNGTHTATLVLSTNDPANPKITIPVVINVSGSAEATVMNSGCVSFTNVQQGATASDSVWVFNTGCDTLDITGFTSGNTAFGIQQLPLHVAPGDSVAVLASFHPLTVGTFTDTIQVLNNDTTFAICVNGTSVGAPVLDLPVDTLVVDLNKCNIIKNQLFRINNTGLGSMTYNAIIGGYRGVSQISYNTTSATTSHTFTGMSAATSNDTLEVRYILHGDYDDYYERTRVYIDNSYMGYLADNNLHYVNDTIVMEYTGYNVQNWTSDGSITIDMINTYDVDGGAGSFHRVEVKLKSQVNWVSIVGSGSGTIAAGNGANKNLLFNAASLAVGTYYTNMNITSNSPGSPDVDVPIQLNVISKAEIATSDTCITFPLTLLNDTTTRDLWVYNRGCQPLSVSGIISTNNDFKVSPSSGSIPVGDSLMVTVSFTPKTIKTYSSSLIITNSDTTTVVCLNGFSGAKPQADFAISYENNCIGEIQFTNTSLYSPTSYLWNFGDGNVSTQASPLYAYAKPGTYNVRLRVTNNIGFDTITKTVTVNPLFVNFSMPNDSVLVNTAVTFYDSSITANSWNWSFGDGGTSSMQNPTHTYTSLGKFQVALEAQDGRNCKVTARQDIYVVQHIGMDELLVDGKSYRLYPNPSAGMVRLESDNIDWSNYQIHITDATGRIIRKLEAAKGTSSIEIDLSQVRAGMYQCIILSNGVVKSTRRVIIQ